MKGNKHPLTLNDAPASVDVTLRLGDLLANVMAGTRFPLRLEVELNGTPRAALRKGPYERRALD